MARSAFKDHLTSMTDSLAKQQIDVPDIWEDSRAAREFEASFLEDVAYRAGLLGGKKGRVVRSIVEALDGYDAPETDDEMWAALELKLKGNNSWTDKDWVGLRQT